MNRMEPFWSAKQGEYVKCPVKSGNHIGIVITKAHCRIEHGMTREEVRQKYGFPETAYNLNSKQIEKLKAGGECQ